MSEPTPGSRGRMLLPIAIAAVAAMFTAVMLLPALTGDSGDGGSAAATHDPTPKASPSASPTAPSPTTGDPLGNAGAPIALGRENAPVVMFAYSDFQCPFCGKFARDTEPELIRKYVDNGTLRIEWRDFPYLGPESLTAAKAARAAAMQGKFWPFHNALYADQPPPNSGKLTEDHLAGIAKRLKLDMPQFRRDLKSQQVADAVARDFSDGQAHGISGTPAFVINGRFVIGAQPLETFTKVIDEAAKNPG
ncbi:DsbA family protein [Actinopolymorpha cephalotaxi]|uniref:Protein-disulfide isomerase n=1 Tax=Actinopolymorpha cephalotaxi TaxID=504797 RepID=A0ABX2S378_9ACTN|nr:protein-disulfide isomerase [Actinopolymorpha cephalotaxi]